MGTRFNVIFMRIPMEYSYYTFTRFNIRVAWMENKSKRKEQYYFHSFQNNYFYSFRLEFVYS